MSKKKKILFIINPISGIGKKNKLPDLIGKSIDPSIITFEIAYTEFAGHGREIAIAKKTDFDAIIAVGGDGSVNEIGSALINSECHLGIIPCGSGNGFARHLKIPLKAKEAIKSLNHWNTELCDTGCINEIPFLGTCGIGFDAHIAKKFDEFHKRGFASYVKLVIKEFKKYQPLKLNLKVGDLELDREPMMACIANSSQFGNGFYISPNSKTNDGYFELALLDKFALWKGFKIAFQFFSKRIHNSKFYETFRFSDDLIIDGANTGEVEIQVDGEPKTTQFPIKIKMQKRSLNVLVT